VKFSGAKQSTWSRLSYSPIKKLWKYNSSITFIANVLE